MSESALIIRKNEVDRRCGRPAPVPAASETRSKLVPDLPLILTLACLLILTLGTMAFSQEPECPRSRQRLSSVTPEAQDPINPMPADGDLELPMPCGLRMVLRHVCVPAAGLFNDLAFESGCINCRSQERRFMEERRQSAVSGPFTLSDLPPDWRALLTEMARAGDGFCPDPDASSFTGFYYFIGKYEVSNQQWSAVMQHQCPGSDRPLNGDDPRPRTDISWFEAMDFSRRYTEWLIQNAPESLPAFSGGRYGYLRLPTEEEWEFAARGGHMVAEGYMSQNDFFPVGGRSIRDFAVFTDRAAAKPPEKLAWIGSKCPNPLGLYDTAGNAAEMLYDLFRYTTGWRLHGTAGGFVAKGGSYRRQQDEVMPGRREEMPFFLEEGPYKAGDLGFRLVLSGIVTPVDHTEALEKGWETANRQLPQTPPASVMGPQAHADRQTRDPMSVLDALAAGTGEGERKEEVAYLREVLKQNGMQLAVQTAQAVRGVILSGIYTAESVYGYSIRRKSLVNELNRLEQLKEEAVSDALREVFDNGIVSTVETVSLLDETIDYLVGAYLTRVVEVQYYPTEVFESQLAFIARDFNREGIISRRLAARLELFKQHVQRQQAHPETLDRETGTSEIIH